MVKLIPAKCPNCGAELQMPDNLDIGFCTHCGGKVIIDKDRMQVHHTGSVSSLPLCPNCSNTLTDGNRLFTCEICGKQECFFCSQLRSREKIQYQQVADCGRIVNNADINLCKECKRKRLISCNACDPLDYYGRHSGRPNGRCSYCLGTGEIKGTWKKATCTQCNGTGICMVCGGNCRDKLIY